MVRYFYVFERLLYNSKILALLGRVDHFMIVFTPRVDLVGVLGVLWGPGKDSLLLILGYTDR